MTVTNMTWDQVCRRAGGRRKYNALRQMDAQLRRAEVARLLIDEGFHLRHRGAQARVARRLHVSEATISRDVRAIFRCGAEHQDDHFVRVRRANREVEREDAALIPGLPSRHN